MPLKMQVLIYEKPTIIISCTLYPKIGNNHNLTNKGVLRDFGCGSYTLEKKYKE